MQFNRALLVLQCFLFTFCFADVGSKQKEKFLNGFLDFLNNLPNHHYNYEGFSINAQKIVRNDANNCYIIEANLKAIDVANVEADKYVKCSAIIQHVGESVNVQNNEYKCTDEHYETVPKAQSSMEKKEMDVHALNTNLISESDAKSVQKREIPGGVSEQDPNEPQFKELANKSLQKYLESAGIKRHHKLIEILSAAVQVVAGQLIELNFRVSPTNCDLDGILTNCDIIDTSDVLLCNSKIHKQPWLQIEDIQVTCEKENADSRVKRHIPGGFVDHIPNEPKYQRMVQKREIPGGVSEQDPNEPQFKELANKSLQKYLESAGIKRHHKLIEILSAAVQVVAGQLIELNFRVSPTNCDLDGILTNCDIIDTSDVLLCNSKIHKQPWLQIEDIQVTCEKENADSRVKRHIPGGFVDHNPNGPKYQRMVQKREIPGGVSEQDPNEPQFKELANKSLQKYLESAGIKQHHKLIEILSAAVQVVAGQLIELKFRVSPTNCDLDGTLTNCDIIDTSDVLLCNSKIHKQPWLQIEDIQVICEKENADSRVKRHISGGFVDHNPNEPKYQRMVQKREIPGGVSEQDPNEPQFKELANKSLQKYLESAGIKRHHKLIEILSAAVQVVAGQLIELKFRVSPTNCDLDGTLTNCDIIDTSDVLLCNSKIHKQPWLQIEDIQVICEKENADSRVKRHISGGFVDHNPNEPKYQRMVQKREIPGGVSEQDPNEPQFKELANKSLQKYLESAGIKRHHKLIEILSAAVQVVAGQLIELNFRVSPTNCDLDGILTNCDIIDTSDVLLCNSKIHKQPWLQIEDIQVTCEKENADSRVKRHISGGFVDHNPNEPKYQRMVQKREIPGGVSEQDPNEPQFKELANKSLQKYLESAGIKRHHKLIEILSAAVQVVAGQLIELNFRVSPTNCDLDGILTNCDIIDTSDVLLCNSKIHKQPWLQIEDIQVTCEKENADSRVKRHIPGGFVDHIPNEPKYQRMVQKREIPGGVSEQDPNEPQFKELANKSLQKYLESAGIKRHHKLIEILSAAVQVVAGQLIELNFRVSPTNCDLDGILTNCDIIDTSDVLLCNSKIHKQPWLQIEDIQVTCEKENADSRVKRHIPGGFVDHNPNGPKYQRMVQKREIPGGVSEQDPNEPQFKELANKSLQKYLESAGIKQHHKLIEILSAAVQVVAGQLIELKFRVSPTNCDLDGTLTNCDIIDTSDVLLCNSKIHKQPWLQIEDIQVICEKENADSRVKRHISGGFVDHNPNEPKYQRMVQKREIPGGVSEQDPNEPQFKELANKSLQKYLESAGIKRHHKLIEILSAAVQVVAGQLIELKFRVSPTNCDLDGTLTNCDIIDTSDVLLCNSKIHKQPWLQIEDIQVICEKENADSRVKRHISGGFVDHNPNEPKYQRMVQKREIPGGVSEQDPNEPQFKELANKSLQKYLESAGIKRHHKLIEILSAAVQVVAGQLIELKFRVSPTNCDLDGTLANCDIIDISDVLLCNSKIHKQPWLQIEDIQVICEKENADSRVKRHISGGFVDHNPNEPKYQRMVQKREIPGGVSEQDPNEPQFKELANKSLQKYLESAGIKRHHKLIEILSTAVQVVAGQLIELKFRVSPTNCDLDGTLANCDIIDISDVLLCNSKIHKQPWLQIEDIQVICEKENADSRVKRHIPGGFVDHNPNEPKYQRMVQKREIPGGVSEQDPNEPQFKDLANKSLQKYLESAGIKRYHKLIEILSAGVQVVAGQLIELKFRVSPTNCDLDDILTNCDIIDTSDVLLCHSKIHKQPWLQIEDIQVTCEKENADSRVKRHIPGGFVDHNPNGPKYQRMVQKREIPGGVSEQDPNEPQFKELANKSLQKYLESAGVKRHHKLIEILSAAVQVVAGQLIELKFRVSPTNCDLDDILTNCDIIDTLDVLLCHSKIHKQPWLQIEDIQVTCEKENADSRVKRHIPGGFVDHNPNGPKYQRMVQKREIPGGVSEQDPNEPQFKELANKSLQKYLESAGIKQHHKLIEILSAAVKVVAGQLIELKFRVSPTNCDLDGTLANCDIIDSSDVLLCNSKIHKQPWLQIEDIQVTCEKENADSRVKRHIPGGFVDHIPNEPKYQRMVQKRQIPGGVSEQDPNEPQFKELANKSLQKYLESAGIKRHHKLIEILSAAVKVVAGQLIELEFRVSPTNCDLDGTLANCDIIDSSDVLLCNSKIHKQPWLQIEDIQVTCEKENADSRVKRHIPGGFVDHNPNEPKYQRMVQKRQIPGGVSEQDPNEPQFKELANKSLQKYLESAGIKRHHKLIEILSAAVKVVAGQLIELEFRVSPTNCDLDGTLANCDIIDSSDVLLCNSKIHKQPWLQIEDIQVTCEKENADSRVKRHIPGGFVDHNPNETKYQLMA